MKKCPECGNPSYDGARACGNCGYKFPQPKAKAPTEGKIFKEEEDKPLRRSDEPSTIEILKENKIIIGIIVLITIIAICGIVLTSPSNNGSNSSSADGDMIEFSEAGFSFSYPSDWKEINGSDDVHPTSIYFDAGNNTVVQYYNITSDSTSLKEITQERISYAQENDDYVDTVQTITLDERNASDIILEEADGNYVRYVSLFSDGKLYVYKISGDSINSINTTSIDSVLESSHIG